MPKAKDGGYVMKRVLLNLEEAVLRQSRRLETMMVELVDEDQNDKPGILAGAAAFDDNTHMLHIIDLCIRGEFTAAEDISDSLNQSGGL